MVQPLTGFDINTHDGAEYDTIVCIYSKNLTYLYVRREVYFTIHIHHMPRANTQMVSTLRGKDDIFAT